MYLQRRLEDLERKELHLEYRIAAAGEATKELIPRGIAQFAPSGTTKNLGVGAPWPPGANCNVIIYVFWHNTGEPLVAAVSCVDNSQSPTFQYNATTNAAGYAFMNYKTGFLWKNGDNCYTWGLNYGYFADFVYTNNRFTINADATGNYVYSAEAFSH